MSKSRRRYRSMMKRPTAWFLAAALAASGALLTMSPSQAATAASTNPYQCTTVVEPGIGTFPASTTPDYTVTLEASDVAPGADIVITGSYTPAMNNGPVALNGYVGSQRISVAYQVNGGAVQTAVGAYGDDSATTDVAANGEIPNPAPGPITIPGASLEAGDVVTILPSSFEQTLSSTSLGGVTGDTECLPTTTPTGTLTVDVVGGGGGPTEAISTNPYQCTTVVEPGIGTFPASTTPDYTVTLSASDVAPGEDIVITGSYTPAMNNGPVALNGYVGSQRISVAYQVNGGAVQTAVGAYGDDSATTDVAANGEIPNPAPGPITIPAASLSAGDVVTILPSSFEQTLSSTSLGGVTGDTECLPTTTPTGTLTINVSGTSTSTATATSTSTSTATATSTSTSTATATSTSTSTATATATSTATTTPTTTPTTDTGGDTGGDDTGGDDTGGDTGGDDTGGDTGGSGAGDTDTLAATGSDTLALGALALLFLQVGAILLVRTLRSRPAAAHL